MKKSRIINLLLFAMILFATSNVWSQCGGVILDENGQIDWLAGYHGAVLERHKDLESAPHRTFALPTQLEVVRYPGTYEDLPGDATFFIELTDTLNEDVFFSDKIRLADYTPEILNPGEAVGDFYIPSDPLNFIFYTLPDDLELPTDEPVVFRAMIVYGFTPELESQVECLTPYNFQLEESCELSLSAFPIPVEGNNLNIQVDGLIENSNYSLSVIDIQAGVTVRNGYFEGTRNQFRLNVRHFHNVVYYIVAVQEDCKAGMYFNRF